MIQSQAKYYLIIGLILLFGQGVLAQSVPPPVAVIDSAVSGNEPMTEDTTAVAYVRGFKPNFRQKYTDKAFQYNEAPLKDEKPIIKKPSFTFLKFLSDLGDLSFLKYFAWLIVAVVLIVLGWILFKSIKNQGFELNNNVLRNLKLVETLSEEVLVKTASLSELEQLITKAEEKQQYRLAVRLHFLILFKKMMQQNHIVYKKDKTNHEYYLEIAEKELKEAFKQVSTEYAYIWYGEYQIDSKKYIQIVQHFQTTTGYL